MMARENIFLKWELKTPHVLHPTPSTPCTKTDLESSPMYFRVKSTDDLPGIYENI